MLLLPNNNFRAILGNVKGQKPYEPPPPKPPANASSTAPQHMDPLAAAEAMASGVRATVQRVTRHPTFQKVGWFPGKKREKRDLQIHMPIYHMHKNTSD